MEGVEIVAGKVVSERNPEMDLDEEFDKMYGDTGSAQEDADLDAEFEKAYGQEPSPVPAADDHSTPLPSKDGGEGEVVQMSHEKPGPRAVSTTGGNEEKVEQIAPNLFMKGNLLFDSENRTVKPGQFVVLSRKDGTSQLLSFNGANKNGKPVFEDVRGVSSLGADIAGRIDIGEDDFDTMLAGGKAKRSRSPLEQVRLGLVAETGDEEKYAPGFVGTARAVVDRMLPYAGRHSRDLSMEQLKHLANIHEGKLDGYAGKNDDERLGVAAADAGLDYIRPGETREAYSMRIRAEADEMLKKRSKAKERAGAELGQTEASAFDKIVKGGVESGGYALEFALPGGVFGKAGQVLGTGRKALRVVSALGSAVPVVAVESRSRYVENTTPEYGVDEHGELERSAAPDSESEAAYKAIGGAALDTAVEIGLESATMGLLRLVGKPAGMALGKMTPRAVKDLGERTFNRFMASETGAALRSINRARQDFTSLTQINSPFGELMEENVQAFEKVLNLDGKTSEYKGFEKELKDYWDRQADWDTQWDIFYGLVAQLAIGAAKSTSDGLASRAATADARRDVRMALARSGISEGAINSLTTKQQKVLTEMWRRYSADPDALKDRAKNLGISMRAAVDELTSREGIDMARSLEQRGIAPEKFAVQVGADGKPAFHRMNRFASDGKSVPMNAMVDEGHGVTIVDQGDGTFYVMNDQRGFTARMADGFAAAKQLADNEVMDNQRRDADNEKKVQYLANLAQGMYTGRNIKVVPTEAALRWGLASAFKNGETPFGLVDAAQVFDADGRLKQQGAGGFHTPDGTVVVILDNVASPSEMERVLAHEATGHEGVESNTGRGENTVEFIRNAKADGFERYKAGERARYVLALVRSGMGEEAANAVADEAMSTDSYQKEAMARYAQGRLHRPTWYERKKHEANEKRRADGESVPFDQADMEVMLAKAEEEGRSPGGKFDIGNADSGVRYFETEQEAADETGNVRDEAPAQPEQGAPEPAGGEAARPVEAQPQGGEAPRQGSVEAAKPGAAEAPTEAPPPMRTEHDFLRVMHDNQKPVRVPVGEIALPDTQFKEGADPKTGVVKGQELKGEYFESAENAVVVYVRKDGTKELVTGRHRFDLAKRNGKNDILARVFREADGYTPEDMRNLDAISNIIDEKGTEHDYIRYFENAKPSRAAAEAAGFLSRSKGRLAFELYEGATEGTRAAIDWSGSGADGLISPEQAGIIAKAAPRDAHPRNGAVQRILVKKAQDGLRGDRLAIVARSLAEEAKRRKAPAADGETQLDLFTSEEDLALLALEEKRAARRVQKANEYGRVAGVLQTAMQKGGRLDLNKAYAKELGIKNPKDRKQLANARQKALEKAEYWRNSVRLDEADKAALDAELGIAPKENLELESVTGDQIAEENRKRAEKEEIERRKAAPLKGGAGEVGQSLMDLGGAEGEDLFNRTQRQEPGDEKPAEQARPVQMAQATAPKAEVAEKPAPAMPTPETTTLLETEKERYIAFQGAHNAFDKVFREAKGDLSASSVQPFVEELKAVIAASPTKELQRRDKSLKRIDTGREDDSYHHVRQMIAEELKRRENAPAGAPQEAAATTHLKAVATESSVKRRYTREPIAFSKPFVGRTGARLVGYEWPNEGEEYVDKRGNDRVRYISDWNYSEVNGETGRDIVHKFHVEMPDGERRTVSAESAAKLLGVSTSQVKGEGLKQIRKKMAVESLPDAQKSTFERITRNNKLLKDGDSVALMKDGTLRILGFRGKADGVYDRWNWHITTISPDGSIKERRLATKPGTKGFELDPADIVEGIRPTRDKQTRENAPVSAPKEAEATTPPRAAKPAEGRKSGDAAVLKEGLTAGTPAKPVAGGKMTKTPPKVKPTAEDVAKVEEGLRQNLSMLEDLARIVDEAAPNVVKSMTDAQLAATLADTRFNTLLDAADRELVLDEAAKRGITPPASPATPSPKAPKTPSVRMKDEAAERKAKAALDAIDFDTPELDGLKSKIRNGTILTEADQRQFAEDVRKGRLRYPRFRADEIAASTGKEHGKLWQYILSLESARMDGRRARGGSEVYGRAASQVRRGGSEWGRVGTGSAQSPSVAYSPKYKKLDSGTESEVFDTGDGWVVKVRQIHPLSIGDVIDELAKVVYHNYLFPGEKYVLDDIVRHEHDGYREFYLILRQPFVTPKTENGRIVQPTYAQIWQLMKSRPQGFTFMDLSSRPAETGEYGDYSSSDGDDGDAVPAVKKVAYNRQFVVYDFQPGRNTFIDEKTGKVRFIDPRIDINDPGAGFRYSKYGTRRKFDGEVDFDTPELGVDSTIVSGDEVRKTMPGYNRLDWSTHVDRTGYVGPRLEAQFRHLLKTRKGKGDGTVVFLAGGNGAGKSTVAAKIGNSHDFTIDSTLGNFEVAKKQIDAILANGQTPEIHFVYRTTGQALEGIAQRVKNGGHIVSPLSFANSHVKSRENLRLLSEAYGDKIHLHIYDNSVDGVPEITLKQLEAKGKPDNERIRENANYYLGHLREREEARSRSQGGVAGGGAKGEASQVDFDTPDFDPERFGKLVTGVGKLVDVLVENGHRDFKALATYIYERDAAKYGRAKPVLQDIWNAVARARGLSRVGDAEAERVFGIIEAQGKEAADENVRRGVRGEVLAGEPAAGGGGSVGLAAGQSAAGGGERQPGGVLASGRVRGENPDARVDGKRPGGLPGQHEGLADKGAAEGVRQGHAGNEAADGDDAVGDRGGSELGERASGRDRTEDGNQGGVSRVKKRADKAADATKPNPPRRDFVMTRSVEDAILEKNTAQRVRNNLDAIKLIRDLKARDYAATPEEQATLAKFVGWGGLREKVFGYALERAYDLERTGDRDRAMSLLRRERVSQSAYDLHKELRSVLNDSEYESAKASASTAFYTPVDFVRVLHDALRNIGVKGGRFLGPSAGTGNFASAAGEYEKPVNWHFVEKDVMTGEMLKALFPNQRVTIGGFEETKFPDGFFDFAIDNVPYADVPISDRSLSSKMFKIHDYFFAKALAKLRPGGVMAFLTSTGTLDKTSPILRQFLTEHGGKIVGAVRMPNGFFSENAGTDVASDLVVVQKVQGRPDNSAFEKGVEYGKTEEWVRRKGRIEKPLAYNGYFQNHPEQVIGTMEVASGQFGPTLKYTMPDGASMLEKVGNAVNNAFNGVDRDALLKSAAVAERQDHTPVYDKEGLRQGNVTMKDGKAFIKSGELLEPIALPNDRKLANEMKRRGRTPSGIMEGLLALRKAMRDVIDAQMSESDTVESDLAPLLANLNAVYDAFVQKNGTLHDRLISPFVLLDKADGNRMLALERVEKFKNEKTGKDESRIVKSDIFTKRVISRGQRATKADTPKDALVISYSETGAINVPRIAELLGVSGEEAVKKLKEGGDAFENPQTGLLEPSWVYLSGRVRAKLAAARAAVEAGEESFRANVEALEKVQPPMVRLEDAEIKFGATWVDPECMKDFLRDAFGAENMRISLGKNEVTGQWNVEFGRVMNEDPWGETSWSPQEFVSRVLNHGSMNHYETDPIDKKRYLNEKRTEGNKLAAEKLHHAFSQFIQSSDKWAVPMYERYNAVMTDMVEIKLPNNVLPFRSAGMSEETLGKLFEGGDPNRPKKGREYQSAVIARGVLGGGSLCLAHCVGAGKTLEMQSIGVLGRHLGLFKKPMYVVPNHMLEQFTNEFVEAFPNANILKMSETDVKPANRRAFFAQVANGDWDAIVVKHSTFSKKLAMSDEYQKEFMEAQRKDLIEAIAAMREAGEKISVDQATKKLERLEAKLKKLANAENHDSQIVPFEELGVDQLFVDEAHNFKGMPITTRQGRTGGLSQGDSQRAEDMLMKTQYVQSLHGGDRGVVFATGTPLSNAPVVEAYVMLKYLVPNKLDEQGLKHFDDFVDAFGRITTESEFSTDGKTVKEKDKVSAFVNIPELMKLLRSAVDIVNSDQLDIPRPKPKYRMIDVDMSPAQEQIMEMVAREAAIPPTKEQRNKYLTLTRIAKNACLTPRLLGFEDGGNKIIRAVAEIKRVYDETAAERGAQLVFTDIFNESEKTREMVDAYMAASDEKTRTVFDSLARRGGKSGAYNLNEEIRDLLVAAGIPKEEIAIVQDINKSKGDKDANKSALFAKVRSGEVRVLIGSRPKMGEGTNVQERLAAIHLLHPGWKPSEDEQAIGRIIRPGNTYKEGQIFYYLTKGNANIGSYETKNHQLIGVKSKLIDQVMHGDDSRREIDMDESAMDRDMLMGLASGNKALMELIDVKKRAHKLELNTESTLTSARRNKDRAEASGRILERKRGEFAQEQEGVKEWREKNDGRPFALTTPDGRSVEKMKDMAELVSGEMTRLLTKDRYDRAERTVLGDFNGVELVLAFDRYGDEKFKLAVPLLGIEREINYSGFVPDFTTAAMTAFKGRILEAVSPDYAKAYENSLNDMERQAKKMSDDADKLQKDYEGMRGELIKLRTRQAQLEREVTPLVVQAVADRSVAAYGNWLIAKPGGGQYVARRESDAKSLSAPTVKELIPLMDAEDFASPRNAATKTVDLRQRLKPDSKGETPKVSKIPVADVDFDSPELSPAEQAYAEAEDKTPTEQVMRKVYGMTNDEIATALKAAGMEPPKHVRKTDETAWKQAEALLSNPSYMAKLSSAVAKFPRNIADYENNALNVLFRRRQAAVNAAQSVADSRKETLDAINAIPKGERDADYGESLEAARKAYGEAASRLAQAKALMHETGFALTRSSSEAGRRLRSNRGLIDQTDLSYAGISGRMATALGGADKITPEMDAKIREIAGEFASLDEEGRDLATVRLKAHAEKIVEQIKRGDKVRKATERKPGDEAKRVMRNYNDALAQIEVGAAEVGGTLVGLSDQQYPAWGKWLRAIGEFHCFENPDITEEECVRAIVEDISPFMDGVDENQVRDALTGFGHNFRQSRYDAQRLMNDLRSQARLKRQMDWMDETNTMPPLTGMVRDEPSDTTRNLQKQVQERKKEVPDAGRDERRLKGVLESAKTRVKNRIADLERAIETGERIPGRDRTVPEDIELRELKKRRDALQQSYDELFKTERGLTDEQRVKLAERLLGRELEHALEDLDRARSGDFSKRPKRPGVESPSIDALRDRLNEVREQIRELKAAKYEFGMTPEEQDAYNARKMANREKALMRLAERIVNGDLRPQKKPQPPMPPEMQKRYDAMGEQMKKARQRLADMRLEAEDATLPSFWRKAGDYLRFVTTAQRALRATMDFSAVLRQSARITLAHPVMGAKAFGKAWNAAHSEANLSVVNDEIMSDPSIQEAVAKYGLHLREVDATSARDVEMFHGMERNKVRIFGKEVSITDIPFFGEFMLKSERHYITYLNAVSAELYSSIVNDRTRFPAGPTAWQKKMVADMINIWNGSAALSKERRQALQKAWVNDILWAPQLAISRIQSAALYDMWHPLVAKGVKNAETGAFDAVSAEERKTMFKIGASEHFKSSLAMIALGALLKWLFADEDDWYDFGQADWFEKLLMLASPKVGNTTIDLTGGEQSVNRAAHKMWKLATSGKVRTGSGRMAEMGSYGGPTVWGVIGRYVQGKTSPWLSELVSLMEGRDYVGNEYTWKDAAMGAAVPLTFEDVKEQLEQNGIGKSLVTIPLSLLGAGGSTYDRKVYENAVNRFLESKKEYDAIEKDTLLDKANRKLLLDSIVSENPLMREEVREDIAADIAQIRRDEAEARKDEKDGNEPDADLLSEIETGKAKLIEKIRSARRR